MSGIRDYRYLSEAKVNHYFDQIEPSILERISAKLEINLGVLKGSLTGREVAANVMQRLRVVESYIDQHCDVGSVDAPARFFRGHMPMCWGTIETQENGGQRIAYFGGRTDATSLGLGGSVHHLSGLAGAAEFHGGSCAPFLVQVLNEAHKREAQSRLFQQRPQTPGQEYGDPRQLALNYVEIEALERGMFPEVLEFLAVPRVVGEVGGRPTVLGSPIYVCAG